MLKPLNEFIREQDIYRISTLSPLSLLLQMEKDRFKAGQAPRNDLTHVVKVNIINMCVAEGTQLLVW